MNNGNPTQMSAGSLQIYRSLVQIFLIPQRIKIQHSPSPFLVNSRKPVIPASSFHMPCAASDSKSAVSVYPQNNFVRPSIYEIRYINILVPCNAQFSTILMIAAPTLNLCSKVKQPNPLIFFHSSLQIIFGGFDGSTYTPSILYKQFFKQIQGSHIVPCWLQV